MIIMSFKTTSHVEVMYNGHHLHQLAYIGDSKLSSFYNKWIEMISNMKASDVPSDDSLRDTLYRKLDGNAEIMKMDLNRYDSANEGDPEHILQFLMNMMKRHIEKGQEKSMLKAKEKALQQYINYGDKKATPSEPEPKDPKPKGPKAKPKSEPKPKASAPSKQADPPPAAPVYPSPSPTRFPLLISSLSGKYSGRATGWVKMWYLCVFKRKSCFLLTPQPQPHNPTTTTKTPQPHNPATTTTPQPHHNNPTTPQSHKPTKPQSHKPTHKPTKWPARGTLPTGQANEWLHRGDQSAWLRSVLDFARIIEYLDISVPDLCCAGGDDFVAFATDVFPGAGGRTEEATQGFCHWRAQSEDQSNGRAGGFPQSGAGADGRNARWMSCSTRLRRSWKSWCRYTSVAKTLWCPLANNVLEMITQVITAAGVNHWTQWAE